MAKQLVPDVAEARLFFTASEKPCQMSIYARNTSDPWTLDNLADYGASLRTWVDSYLSVLSNAHTYVGMSINDLGADPGNTFEDIEATPVQGDVAEPALPNNVALKATFVGGQNAYPRRGGVYLLPPTEAQVGGNFTTTTFETAIEAIMQILIDEVSAPILGRALVIVSRYNKALYPTPPHKRPEGVSNTVASITVKRRMDTQRRRLPVETV